MTANPSGRDGTVETSSECRLAVSRVAHRFKITNWSLMKEMSGVDFRLKSADFTVGGQEWFMELQLYKEDIYVYVRMNAASFAGPSDGSVVNDKVFVQVGLVDFAADDPTKPMAKAMRHVQSAVQQSVTSNTIFSFNLIKTKLLEEPSQDFLRDDCFVVVGEIHVGTKHIKSFPRFSVDVPPSDIVKDLATLFDGDAADVVFDVAGRSFRAHRCILAARSRVFAAMLLGPMKEGGGDKKRVEITGVSPEVFGALLRFFYTDELPPEGEKKSVAMTQDLLAEADKYGMLRMRAMCEERLLRTISVHNVGATLILAAQHNCSKLKELCMEYIVWSGRWNEVMASEGFQHLELTCPWVLRELLERLTPRRALPSPAPRPSA